jgi:hypothetical protein
MNLLAELYGAQVLRSLDHLATKNFPRKEGAVARKVPAQAYIMTLDRFR